METTNRPVKLEQNKDGILFIPETKEGYGQLGTFMGVEKTSDGYTDKVMKDNATPNKQLCPPEGMGMATLIAGFNADCFFEMDCRPKWDASKNTITTLDFKFKTRINHLAQGGYGEGANKDNTNPNDSTNTPPKA